MRNGGRAWLGSVVPRLDGEGEFGEGGREPMLWVLLHAEFVVATSEVLDEGVASADHPSQAQSFKATHRPQARLQAPMIGFDGLLAYCSVISQVAGSSSSRTRG